MPGGPLSVNPTASPSRKLLIKRRPELLRSERQRSTSGCRKRYLRSMDVHPPAVPTFRRTISLPTDSLPYRTGVNPLDCKGLQPSHSNRCRKTSRIHPLRHPQPLDTGNPHLQNGYSASLRRLVVICNSPRSKWAVTISRDYQNPPTGGYFSPTGGMTPFSSCNNALPAPRIHSRCTSCRPRVI